jgi:glycine hydroxymethyltransferase
MMRTTSTIISDHERLVSKCLRLLPSENIMSPAARQAMISDVEGRYHVKFYGGKKYIMELVDHVTGLARQLFHARHAFVTPLSGNICDLSVLLAFTRPGDKIAIISTHAGYPMNIEYLGRYRVRLPVDEDGFNLDLPGTITAIEQANPALVILGSSFILHPIPGISRIVAAAHAHGGKVVYDGAHPLGLIAGGQFQDPLGEGVDVLIGSTHKSFPGPQGGLILTNDDEAHARLAVVAGAEPDAGIVLVDNPHPGRIAALGITLEELVDHGARYATQVIKNARALQSALLSSSLKDKIAGMAQGLESRRVWVDAGVRLGTAEVTRLGYQEKDMKQAGACIATMLSPGSIAADVNRAQDEIDALVRSHQELVM